MGFRPDAQKLKKEMKRILLLLLITITATGCFAVKMTSVLSRPDLDAIRAAVLDEDSRFYYPRLLKEFLANDTTMTPEDFQYFYYGTLFQEDYDPYRPSPSPATQSQLAALMNKTEWKRAERKMILDYANEALADNPVNLRQLTNRIFIYEQNGKHDLAKIWQYKLNHLLLVIAASGNGTDPDNAWVVVYPQDEYDFLNLSGITIKEARFESPCYDYVVVNPRTSTSPAGYYFNIGELLRQYYLKHPSEK